MWVKVMNVALVLMVFGSCSASPGMMKSPEMVKKIAKVLLQECNSSDVSSTAGFNHFLYSLDQRFYRMMMEAMNFTDGNYSDYLSMKYGEMMKGGENGTDPWNWMMKGGENGSDPWNWMMKRRENGSDPRNWMMKGGENGSDPWNWGSMMGDKMNSSDPWMWDMMGPGGMMPEGMEPGKAWKMGSMMANRLNSSGPSSWCSMMKDGGNGSYPWMSWDMMGADKGNASDLWMWGSMMADGKNGSYPWNWHPWTRGFAGGFPNMKILMLLKKLSCAKTDPEYGPVLGRCMENSRISEVAWDAVVANLTKMCPWTLYTILGGSKDYILRSEADVVDNLPTVSSPFQLGIMMYFFRGLYPEMEEEMRGKVFKWAKRSLRSSMCKEQKPPYNNGPPPNMRKRRTGGSTARCSLSWVSEDTVSLMGIFIMQASNGDFAQVRPEQVCELIEESDFLARLSETADDLPDRVNRVMDILQAQCGDNAQLMNISRSGPLACYMANMDSMDTEDMERRLTKLRGCKNDDAKKNIAGLVRELAMKRPVDSAMLSSMGESASALTNGQIANISDAVILDTIEELGEGRSWSRRQSRNLVRKFLQGGGQVYRGSDLVMMGSLVRGLRSGTLRNVSGPELLRAARDGLEDEARDMSPFQRGAIVGTILAGVTTTDAIESLSGSLLLVVPLSALVAADAGSLTNITRKQWNVGQALYLCTIILNNGSMTEIEFSKLGALTQGVTCEKMANYADQFGTRLGLALGNATWLSRNQLTCAGQNMRDIVKNLPAGTTAAEIQNLAESLPSPLLLHIGEEAIARLYDNDCPGFLAKMAGVKMECLPRSSPVRGQLRARAINCLGGAVPALGVLSMGALVCEFTGTNVSQLTNAAFNASIPLLATCRQFQTSARSELVTRLVLTLGPVSQWSVDTVRSLGSLLTLLDQQTLSQLPDTEEMRDVLSDCVSVLPELQLTDPPELRSGFSLDLLRQKIFTSGRLLMGATRRRRAVGCTDVPGSEEIAMLGQANVGWSVEELACMTTGTFSNSVDILGAVTGFSDTQTRTLMDKAIQTWGPVSVFSDDNIMALQCIVTAASLQELFTMKLDSIDTLAAIGLCPWTPAQREAVLGRYLLLSKESAATLDSTHLNGLSMFTCALNTSSISQLNMEAFKLTAASLGRLTCDSQTLDALKDKAVEAFGPVTDWKEDTLTELGTILAGASEEELKSLAPNLMPYLGAGAICLMPPERFQALSVAQLQSLSPDNAAAVTDEQKASLTSDQQTALLDALGLSQAKATGTVVASHSPGSCGPSFLTQLLLTLLLLFTSFTPSP